MLSRFGRDPTDQLPLGQPLGPFKVRGGGKIPLEKTFYVAKVRTIVDIE